MALKASKEADSGFLKRLQSTLNDGEVPVAWCDFSPGPSWGFNGIQTIVLTNQNLRVYQRGIALTARRDAAKTGSRIIPLAYMNSVTTKSRDGLFGSGAFTMKVTWDGGHKLFTTKYAEGADLARQLEQLIGKSKAGFGPSVSPLSQETPLIPVTEQLERFAAMHEAGSLTDTEFQSAKSKLLS
jgi:hypothetical protein